MGSYGVSSGAAIAARMTTASRMSPASKVALRPTFCSRMLKPTRSTGATCGLASTCSLIRHPWIEKRVRQIDQEIHQDYEQRGDDDDRLDDGIVATGHRREQQLAYTWYGEYCLDDQGTANQKAELHA